MGKFAAGGIFAGLLGIDQAVKQYIEENYDEEREEKTKIPGVLLRKFYNKGLIFSSFDWNRSYISGRCEGISL